MTGVEQRRMTQSERCDDGLGAAGIAIEAHTERRRRTTGGAKRRVHGLERLAAGAGTSWPRR